MSDEARLGLKKTINITSGEKSKHC
jgi:hypothetical protein